MKVNPVLLGASMLGQSIAHGPKHQTIKVSAPAKASSKASWIVPHDFASFSFPAHWFADFCGNATHPNLFSRDIFDLLYSKTGAHPFVRVGGTSTDRVWYNESQSVGLINYYEKSDSDLQSWGIPDWVYIGPAFFDGFNNFPGSHWSWQINMGKTFGKPGGLENALEVGQKVMDVVQDKLETFEIGNEPDLMARIFSHRPADYDMDDYVSEWLDYANATSETVLKGNKYGLEEKRFFQALTFAGGENPVWNIQEAWKSGVDEGGFVKTITYHQYAASNQGWVRLQNSYMNHTANAANVTQYNNASNFAHSQHPPLPFILGETNSNSWNLNMEHVSGVFGSALWLIDHLLLGMVANIKRYNLIQGTVFSYTGWVPVKHLGRPPHVRPPLYGQIFAADVLGHHPEVKVYEVPKLPWNMAAYGIYESDQLERYVIINFEEYNTTARYKRPVREHILKVPHEVKSVRIQRLAAAGADALEGITWSGQSWNYTAGRLEQHGKLKFETAKAHKGEVKVKVPSSEAILVHLEGKRGRNLGSD